MVNPTGTQLIKYWAALQAVVCLIRSLPSSANRLACAECSVSYKSDNYDTFIEPSRTNRRDPRPQRDIEFDTAERDI